MTRMLVKIVLNSCIASLAATTLHAAPRQLVFSCTDDNDLFVVTKEAVPGVKRSDTPAEAIDLLNSVLLTKGFTLIRRDRMLMLINLEDGIPPNLVPYVPLDELDDKGEFELISVLFKVQRMSRCSQV